MIAVSKQEQQERRVVWVFIGVLLIVGAGITAYGTSELNKSLAARHWPVTIGSVEACNVKTRVQSGGESGDYEDYIAQVTYRYQANGRTFEREYLAYAYDGDDSARFPEKLCAQLRGARSVDVRYDPQDPNEAFLAWGPSRAIILILYAGIWVLLFSSGLMLDRFRWRSGRLEQIRLDILKDFNRLLLITFIVFWFSGFFVDKFYLYGLATH